MKIEFDWETIKSKSSEYIGIQRAKVINGWIVKEWYSGTDNSHRPIIFIQDITHQWETSEEYML
jgi:hypothetical protein